MVFYEYDANGNLRGLDGHINTIAATSNRLTRQSGPPVRRFNYDAAGNVLSDGLVTFEYDDSGRMVSAKKGSATTSYLLNALGQRIRKTTLGAHTYFIYDEQGHLLGEYDGAGALKQEIVWLDDTPIATLRRGNSGATEVFYIHTDHLNTPRRISRPSDNAIVWRWNSVPFGNTPANGDADGDGIQFEFNLRFPGQYFDVETGLHYNYFRDYDPATGRYVQSDPIGLGGGVNTYAYVGGNPINVIDPEGLEGVGPWNSAETLGSWQQDPCINAATVDSILNVTPVVGLIKALAGDPNSLDLVSGGATTAAATTAYAAHRSGAISNERLRKLQQLDRNRREQAALQRFMAADRGMRQAMKMFSRAFTWLGMTVEAKNFAKAVEQCRCQKQ